MHQGIPKCMFRRIIIPTEIIALVIVIIITTMLYPEVPVLEEAENTELQEYSGFSIKVLQDLHEF
jgi:hypothetical protein